MSKKKNMLLAELEFIAVASLFRLIEAIPLSMAYGLSGVLAKLAFLVDAKHRRRTIDHLVHAGMVPDRHAAKAMAKRNFINIAKLGVEICKSKQFINADNIKDHVSLAGSPEAADLMFGKREHVIALSPHFGFWEFSAAIYTMMSDNNMVSIIRPFDNPKIGAYINDKRISEKHRLRDKDGALKTMLSALKNGETIGFVADQHAGRDVGVEISFFGHPARAHAAPAMLHLRTGVPIVVGGLKRLDDNMRFELILEDPIRIKPGPDKEADVKKVAQTYMNAMEKIIRNAPEQWLWAHRRWLDLNRKR